MAYNFGDVNILEGTVMAYIGRIRVSYVSFSIREELL